jgi:O-antigen/teichoic acid export membrane protein
LMNVCFNLILIPKYNIYGASLAKTLSELFILFLTYYISQRLHKSSYHLYHNFIPLIGVIFIVFVINSYELWFCKFVILKFILWDLTIALENIIIYIIPYVVCLVLRYRGF